MYGCLSILVMFVASGLLLLLFYRREDSFLEQVNWASQSVVGVIALATAIFVGLQIADVRRSLGSTAFETTASRILEITKLSLDHQDEYSDLCRDKRPTVGASILAEAYLDIIDTELLRRRALPDAWTDELPSLDQWIEDLFIELPGLRYTLIKRQSWYSDELFGIMRRAIRCESEFGNDGEARA
jgi:hypothetical protein